VSRVGEFLSKLVMVTGQKSRREIDEIIDKEIRKHDARNVDNEVHKTELLKFNTTALRSNCFTSGLL